MRENEYYGYATDEAHIDTRRDTYDDVGSTETHTNEMARNAVERFLESETGDYIAGYDTRKAERPDKSGAVRASRPVSHAEPEEGVWCPPPPPDFEDDEEFMAKLANIRRDRPRRDPNPMPRPAVRVNAERRRTPSPVDRPADDLDWGPLEEDDIDSFRGRYSVDDVMSAPKEARIKEPRSTVPVSRREADRPASGDGPGPLRYLLAIVFVGVLFLMAFLALNNRNLRRDLDAYQAQVARIEDNAQTLERQNIEINSLNTTLAAYREQLALHNAQLQEPGIGQNDDTPHSQEEEIPNRPSDETPADEPPPPPPPPEPVIHVVQAGQFLSHIAREHFGTGTQHYINLILAANPDITNPNNIREGQEIIIPPRE